jgi:ubiquinone/menaquinone biosynthesis C-methylase UbiE
MGTRDTRGVRYWNRVSGTTQLVERIPAFNQWTAIMRNATGLTEGETVLDVGCGAGSFFPQLREMIGADGHLVGIDVAPAMITRARARIERAGWTNVEARVADATDPNLPADLGPGRFDAAFAMYSISAVPDIAPAVALAYEALRPGGRLFVADVRLVPGGRAAGLIRLLRGAYRRLAGATGDDIVPYLRDRFDTVTMIDKHGAPTERQPAHWPPLVLLVATKA